MSDRLFYILPKIHKAPKDWAIPFKVPKGRPIVANINTETTELASYVEEQLETLTRKLDRIVRSTEQVTEFINKHNFPKDVILFTLDVESLYTNLPITESIYETRNLMEKHPNPNRPDKELIKLVHTITNNNIFKCNGKKIHQKKGVAMGVSFARTLADIYVAALEDRSLSKWKSNILAWLRYIDDVFGVWLGTHKELEEAIADLELPVDI